MPKVAMGILVSIATILTLVNFLMSRSVSSSNISIQYNGKEIPVHQDGNTYSITLPNSDNITIEYKPQGVYQ